MKTHGKEDEEEEKEVEANSDKAAPEGFFEFFRSEGELPEASTDRLVELDELVERRYEGTYDNDIHLKDGRKTSKDQTSQSHESAGAGVVF